MKKMSKFLKLVGLMLLTMVLACTMVEAQNAKEQRIIGDSKKAKAEFVKTDKLMQSLFNNSYA